MTLTITSSTPVPAGAGGGTNFGGTLTFTGVGSEGTLSYDVGGNISLEDTADAINSGGYVTDFYATFDPITGSFNISQFEGYTATVVFQDGGLDPNGITLQKT
jgi:hypothetical protein